MLQLKTRSRSPAVKLVGDRPIVRFASGATLHGTLLLGVVRALVLHQTLPPRAVLRDVTLEALSPEVAACWRHAHEPLRAPEP